MAERKLVTIERIKEIRQIAGADAIECAIVRSWPVVVKKDDFSEGDWVLFYEIDSFLPIKPEYEFLRKGCFKRLPDGTEGFRLKTIKLRGQVSQGLIMPIFLLNDINPAEEMVIGVSSLTKKMQLGPYDDALIIEEGADVTDLLQVIKWEPPVPACLAGQAKGNFPSFIRKTDEERIQNCERDLQRNLDKEWYETEKLEGSSATYYFKDEKFGTCSRNLDLEEVEGNSMWNFARAYNLEEKMRSLGRNIAIQGEIIGPGIQGNIYKLNETTVRFFSVFDIDKFEYLGYYGICDVLERLGLTMVPVLGVNKKLPGTAEEILKIADGKSALNDKVNREGVVFRTMDGQVSFKAISNVYLISTGN